MQELTKGLTSVPQIFFHNTLLPGGEEKLTEIRGLKRDGLTLLDVVGKIISIDFSEPLDSRLKDVALVEGGAPKATDPDRNNFLSSSTEISTALAASSVVAGKSITYETIEQAMLAEVCSRSTVTCNKINTAKHFRCHRDFDIGICCCQTS